MSGGERSYTTLALLMSLTNSIDSPFTCMDEFDVFMDLSNRKIAIRMLIEVARKMSNRQFILLSPLSIDFLKEEKLAGEDVKLHRMRPPDRGQQTLVESNDN